MVARRVLNSPHRGAAALCEESCSHLPHPIRGTEDPPSSDAFLLAGDVNVPGTGLFCF